MNFFRRGAFRAIVLGGLLLGIEPLHAEYRRIRLKVYGLDCELCARGVGASIHRLTGVRSVEVSLRTGTLDVELNPGNEVKMSDLRNRIRENGFRPVEATVTAVGRFKGSRFEVLGTGESYDVAVPDAKGVDTPEITFVIR